MADTIIVLVLALISQLAVALIGLVATFKLAKRNGQSVKSMSFSLHRGYTAEFHEKER